MFNHIGMAVLLHKTMALHFYHLPSQENFQHMVCPYKACQRLYKWPGQGGHGHLVAARRVLIAPCQEVAIHLPHWPSDD